MLLQLAAPHITFWSLLAAFTLRILWSLAVTSHHAKWDVSFLRASSGRAVRFVRIRPAACTIWCDDPVINQI